MPPERQKARRLAPNSVPCSILAVGRTVSAGLAGWRRERSSGARAGLGTGDVRTGRVKHEKNREDRIGRSGRDLFGGRLWHKRDAGRTGHGWRGWHRRAVERRWRDFDYRRNDVHHRRHLRNRRHGNGWSRNGWSSDRWHGNGWSCDGWSYDRRQGNGWSCDGWSSDRRHGNGRSCDGWSSDRRESHRRHLDRRLRHRWQPERLQSGSTNTCLGWRKLSIPSAQAQELLHLSGHVQRRCCDRRLGSVQSKIPRQRRQRHAPRTAARSQQRHCLRRDQLRNAVHCTRPT
jgi:hypothetical protein